jgi:very-short-patch-repair endonuclease
MTGAVKPCGHCGIDVYVGASRLSKGGKVFCSTEHYNEWQSRGKTTHTCKSCGESFRWSPSRSKSYNITYCSLGCRDADPDRRAMLLRMNADQQRRTTNGLERVGYEQLDQLDISYYRQHLIADKFCVDAFIESAGIVVQFDGDYWHGRPDKFPDPDARQRKRMRLDRSQDAYLRKCGFRIVRFWESDVKARPDVITETIRPLLARQ